MFVCCTTRSVRLCLAVLLCLPARLCAQAPIPPLDTGKPPAPSTTVPPAVQKAMTQWDKAIALHRAKKVSEAVAAYKEFLRLGTTARLSPQMLALAHLNLASLYQSRGDAKAQEAALQQVVRLDPKSAIAYTQLALLASGQRRLDDARFNATQALRLNPPPALAVPAHFTLGVVAAARNDLATAEKELGAAVKLDPGNGRTRFQYALVLDKQRKIPQALAAAQKASELLPQLPQARLLLADIKQKGRDFPGALAAYDAVLKLDAHNSIALFNRALLLDQMGRTPEAISAYLTSLAVQPGVAAHQNVGALYIDIKNYTAAKAHYRQANALKKNDPTLLTGLGLSEMEEALTLLDPVQRKTGLEQAEAHLSAATKLVPNDPAAQNSLARLYERTGRYDDALKIYTQRLAAEPQNVTGYHQIARLYTMQRQPEKVLEIWYQYRKQVPADPTSYEQAAHILEAQGKQEAAIAEWQELLKRSPHEGNALLAIAQDLALLKRYDAAKEKLQAVLALDPTAADLPEPARALTIPARTTQQLDALRALAKIAQEQSHYTEAVTWLDAVKTRENGLAAKNHRQILPEPYLAIAHLHEQNRQPDLAVAELQALIRALPGTPMPYVELAHCYERQQKIEAAASALQEALARGKDDKEKLDLRIQIADLYRNHAQIEPALNAYRALQKEFPKETRFLSNMAQALEQAGQDAEALDVYKRVLEADPRLVWIHDKQATLLIRMKRYAEARALYEKELDRAPENLALYTDLARCYAAEGKSDAYLAWVQARFERTPAAPTPMRIVLEEYIHQQREEAGWAYLRRIVAQHTMLRPVAETFAALLLQHKRTAEALEVYRQLATRYPNDLAIQTAFASQLFANGQQAEATQRSVALIARPDLPSSERISLRRQLADWYAQRKMPAEAIAQYKEVVQAQPEDFEAQAALARLLTASDREEEAIPLYQKLLLQQAYPASMRAQICTRLGSIYEKQGHKMDAIAQYREALKLNPMDAEATAALRRLEAKESGG